MIIYHVFPIFIFYFYLSTLFGLPIDDMTLEEKIGQLFIVYFDGNEVNQHAEVLIEEGRIGGFIFYNWANGLKSPEQVLKLSRNLQSLAKKNHGLPLFLSVDQEGGRVARLKKGFTEFPGNGALGRTENTELAYKASLASGIELNSVGINVNFAPVVDVNTNIQNPVIGIRAYDDEPHIVSKFGYASVKGYLESGVFPCIKHFPGYGDVVVDSHFDLPIVNKSLEELEEIELIPFLNLAKQVPMIMTAHVFLPNIDQQFCATCSSTLLQDILRKKIGYEGILITDSLMMNGVRKGFSSLEECAIAAFKAGNDILLLGGRDLQKQVEGETNVREILRVTKYFQEAVRSGTITEERVNESVRRILALKEKLSFEIEDDLPSLRNNSHMEIAYEIAEKSVEIISWDFSDSLSSKEIIIVAPRILYDAIQNSELVYLGKSTSLIFFNELIPSSIEYSLILNSISKADVVLFFSYNCWKIPDQLKLLNKIAKLKPTVCIATADPNDLEVVFNTRGKIKTLSPTTAPLQVIFERLKNR